MLGVLLLLSSANAAEPFFKKNDVIALVGGEDMVVASEYGYLETLLTRALPDYHLRFRNLAWEGDTVYEQHRDLNFPSWEEQLDKIGATVVICQFGQMESLDGMEKLPEFIAAYEKLLKRFSAGGKRRIVLLQPSPLINSNHLKDLESYRGAVNEVARMPIPGVESAAASPARGQVVVGAELYQKNGYRSLLRDGCHLNADGQKELAYLIGHAVDAPVEDYNRVLGTGLEPARNPEQQRLLSLINAKNKLWFDYWRVENWAFLFGDRTNQPSSRDHRDPSKRWFPAEREEFIPLIEAKEKEIAALAAKLGQK